MPHTPVGTHPATPIPASRLIGWLSLAQLITWGSVFYTFALLMEPIERELGLNRAQASLGFSLALLAEGLLAYPVGRWIDLGHERVVMTGGSLLVGACLLLHSGISSALGFYAVWLGLGAGLAATLYPPAFAVLTRRYPHNFRRAIITLTFLGGLASTVFIPLSAWLLRHAPTADQSADRAENQETPGHAKVPRAALGQHLWSAPSVLIGAFIVLLMATTAALPAHLVSLLRENQLPEAWVLATVASIGVLQVLGRALMYFFEHHVDLHQVNRFVPTLIPLGLAALLIAPMFETAHAAWVLLFVILYGLGNGMLTIVKGTAVAEYVNRDHVATLNGALGLMWSPQLGHTTGLWLLLITSLLGLAALMAAQRLSTRA